MAAAGISSYLKVAQSAGIPPMGIFPFVIMLALGIATIMATQIVVGAGAYWVGNLLRRGRQGR